MKSLPLPSLSRSDPDFWPTGGYWRGSPWLPTSYMAIKALDARAGHGDYALARRRGGKTARGGRGGKNTRGGRGVRGVLFAIPLRKRGGAERLR